jgi:hypothetical protein
VGCGAVLTGKLVLEQLGNPLDCWTLKMEEGSTILRDDGDLPVATMATSEKTRKFTAFFSEV